MKRALAEESRDVALEDLDLGHVSLFVGQRMNEVVLARLHAAGYGGLRVSHGYLVQHLVGGERSVTELGRLLSVSQQAASKVVRELSALGYVERARGADRRARLVRLSRRGRAMLRRARAERRRLEASLIRSIPGAHVARTRATLLRMLHGLGGAEAVRRRRVREPR